MLFTSFKFIFFFLPVVYLGFLLACQAKRLSLISCWLLLSSIAFYGFWSPNDLIPLAASIAINYLFYLMIKPKDQNDRAAFSTQTRRRVLIVAIGLNLLFLGFYKYMDFFIHLVLFRSSLPPSPESIYIPLGISFYTFTQIAFLVDCYKRNYEKNDVLNYSLFVSYFPHLVCGPILSFKELYPQLINANKFRPAFEHSAVFLFCFSIGLFKKAVLGDYLGMFSNQLFDVTALSQVDFRSALLGVLCYALQLYFDFSGYSDMAVGLSYLFGLKIPDNFNAPYQASSIIDFWRRWHISLSNFLKDYVYIPLGGNRCSALKIVRNLWITMLLGGLWHGASWTFIAWGGYQGLLLSLNHWLRNHTRFLHYTGDNAYILRANQTLKIAFTFVWVSLGWVLFRSKNLDQALNIYGSLFGIHTWYPSDNPTEAIRLSFQYPLQGWILCLGLGIIFWMPETSTLRGSFIRLLHAENKHSLIIKTAAASAGVALVGILCFSKAQYFLYSGF